MDPAAEWLAARLPGTPLKVTEEAYALGITPDELREARKALNVQTEVHKPTVGAPYERWVVGPKPAPVAQAAKQAITRAEDLPKKQAPEPKERVRHAKARLQRHALRHARYLEELTQFAARDPQKCPTCGRGTPRAESVRLQAILAALGIAGLTSNPKGETGDEGQSSPAIVFPPGTRIAVLAESHQPDVSGVGRPPAPQELRPVRADQIGPLDRPVGSP